MNSLLLGVQYITKVDRECLSFCGEQVTEKQILTFLDNLRISDACLSHLALFPAPKVLRNSILLAFAAMKSEDFPERTVYGFRIAIRSKVLIDRKVFLDADGENILYAVTSQEEPGKWEIRHISPRIFSEFYLYRDAFITAVLKACNDVYHGRS